uniref:Uncharacterized protein n=1 Tax=Arundo donax TaxID=35708 RepID=A0A0A9AKH5_ARUDO
MSGLKLTAGICFPSLRHYQLYNAEVWEMYQHYHILFLISSWTMLVYLGFLPHTVQVKQH